MVAGVALTPLAAQSSNNQLEVGVRTQLDRQKLIWDGIHSHKLENPPEHGKIYAIFLMQPVDSVLKPVRPIDAQIIARELTYQLETHGYHHVEPKHKPDILLTVIYGRSNLPNPYFTRKTNVDNMGPELPFDSGSAKAPGQKPGDESAPPKVAIDDPAIRERLMENGVEAKATKSGFEKLFILVRAWKYPSGPKEKPEALWVATMYVDDPDHRDLNLIAKQMLEAGAPYFDREIKGEEVEVYKPLPDGHVNVGAPEVIQSDPKQSK
jgi:hypothetical protein